MDEILQSCAEQVLGFRVVRIHKGHTAATGIQRQYLGLNSDNKVVVVRVAPAEESDLKMFTILCTPYKDWDKL